MEHLCKKCILPNNYSGISFNEMGICNLCESFKKSQYLGEDKLKEDINTILKEKNEYDCVVGFSGGRDSTYLLWYIVNVLRLKPLAVFVDSKLIPETTISNIEKTIKILGVDLIVRQHDFLKNTVKHFLTSWLNYPHPATLITLCTGCRLGITRLLEEETINRNIPILFAGGTPFEQGLFKKNLIATNRNSNLSFVLGYGKQIIHNPSLISNLSCLKTQIDEYFTVPWAFISKNRKMNYIRIEPFLKYFRWEEQKIEDILKQELNWERYPGIESSYRGDCEVGIIRQFLYNKMLGYNDKDDHLSWLIRDKQISREEALNRISKEKETGLDILKLTFAKLGFDYTDYINKIEKNVRKHNKNYMSIGV
jgi:hypothetical protein